MNQLGLSADRLELRLAQLRELEKVLTFRIARLGKLLDMQSGQMLSELALPLTHYRILLVASIFGEISVSDLSRTMAIDRAQISRSAAEMQRAGLVAINGDPTNKRRKLVSLTDDGRATLDAARPAFIERQARLEAATSADDFAAFERVTAVFTAMLADELGQPEAMPADLRAAQKAVASVAARRDG